MRRVFISYSWDSHEHRGWVRDLGERLRENEVDVVLDQWSIVPGDQLPHFMERSVRESDYVLIVCTPRYKLRSNDRIRGVGYEGDIMTGEVLHFQKHTKFIPLLRSGIPETSLPSWLLGKFFLDFRDTWSAAESFQTLLRIVKGERPHLSAMTSPGEQNKFESPPTPIPPSVLEFESNEQRWPGELERRYDIFVMDRCQLSISPDSPDGLKSKRESSCRARTTWRIPVTAGRQPVFVRYSEVRHQYIQLGARGRCSDIPSRRAEGQTETQLVDFRGGIYVLRLIEIDLPKEPFKWRDLKHVIPFYFIFDDIFNNSATTASEVPFTYRMTIEESLFGSSAVGIGRTS